MSQNIQNTSRTLAEAGDSPSVEEVASVAAGIYDDASRRLTPEIVAAIAAAVRVTAGRESRILSIRPVSYEFARSGRSAHMYSHSPLRG